MDTISIVGDVIILGELNRDRSDEQDFDTLTTNGGYTVDGKWCIFNVNLLN